MRDLLIWRRRLHSPYLIVKSEAQPDGLDAGLNPNHVSLRRSAEGYNCRLGTRKNHMPAHSISETSLLDHEQRTTIKVCSAERHAALPENNLQLFQLRYAPTMSCRDGPNIAYATMARIAAKSPTSPGNPAIARISDGGR